MVEGKTGVTAAPLRPGGDPQPGGAHGRRLWRKKYLRAAAAAQGDGQSAREDSR